ncbi:hypothetical protein SUGI_0917040 [Cryptomeria japonica]|nr:hypothetical protein SUGI_0917040 [Cryptomeria japonica]
MTEMIVRNFIAFALFSSESEEDAVTSFASLLEEMTQDAQDAEVFRRNGILVNWVGSDDKMVEIVKILTSSTTIQYDSKIQNGTIDSLSSSLFIKLLFIDNEKCHITPSSNRNDLGQL